MVSCINHEHDAVNSSAVFTPCFSGLEMATQVVRIKPNISNCHFCLMRMNCAVGLCKSVTLQHVQQSSLSCVIEAKGNDVC